MENIYFYWWLKYIIHSNEGNIIEHIPEAIRELKDKFPDFNKVVNNLKKAEEIYNSIEPNINLYEITGEDIHLQEIEKLSKNLDSIMMEIYKELEFFNRFIPVKEETFLDNEAEKDVEKSGLFIGIEHLVNNYLNKSMTKEEILEHLDGLRETIYDIEEEELSELSKISKETESQHIKELSQLYGKGFRNVETGIKIIERSLQKENRTDAIKGLKKIREGLIGIKVIELFAETRGGVK